ncbi:polysaccharide deacetylase family protein [Phenylobacterium sp.]|jgi:hypothetical protein|uniref:polysaccharide deacetylase family protein n=1 Tax=Phenylobacterium sp. TaxID=1871053 RepID=UPI002F3F2C3C
MDRIAVVSFDEPEFEPSYGGTDAEGASIFAWLFFTGRCRLSPTALRLLNHNIFKGSLRLGAALYYSALSLVAPKENIFEFLRREEVPATFFAIFELLDDPDSCDLYLPLFRRILADGHELALHGYRHGPLTEDDLRKSLALALERLGATLTTYSSPFGDDRVETLRLLEAHRFLGMRVWDRSFLNRDSPVQRIAYDYSLSGLTSRDDPVVVLNLHSRDFYPWGFSKVKRAIRSLRRRGYRFTTFRTLCKSLETGVEAGSPG